MPLFGLLTQQQNILTIKYAETYLRYSKPILIFLSHCTYFFGLWHAEFFSYQKSNRSETF